MIESIVVYDVICSCLLWCDQLVYFVILCLCFCSFLVVVICKIIEIDSFLTLTEILCFVKIHVQTDSTNDKRCHVYDRSVDTSYSFCDERKADFEDLYKRIIEQLNASPRDKNNIILSV